MMQLSFLEDNPKEVVSWKASREMALERLHTFSPRTGRAYASNRNVDFGPENRTNISCLSPWIRHRLLLEEEVLRATLSRHSPVSAEKFIQEVFWRTYFKGWLEQRPSVWFDYRVNVLRLIDELDRSSTLRNHYEAAINGKTGIECFDAWSRELIETGYLHNHTRMWFASIWVFTLHLPWQLGADFFYRHLLDADPASNTLSWRWVTGLHTRGKTYLARQSNIEKYTDGRFSPHGLAKNAPPLVEDVEHLLQPLPTPTSLTDKEPFALLITEEDCNPETLNLPVNPKGICSLSSIKARSPFKTGKLAVKFTIDALDDALERTQAHFECETVRGNLEDWGCFLAEWAQSLDVKTIVTAWLPVGPAQEKMAKAQSALHQAGVKLVQIRRPYDEVCWPHATRGFFKLKAKIPNLIEQLSLNQE